MYSKTVTIFLIGILLPLVNIIASDFIVKNQSDSGLDIEFTPQRWTIHQEIIAGKLYYKIDFQNSNFNSLAGKPQLPERIMIVGIPFAAKVTTEILEVETEKTLQGRIIPVATYRQKEQTEIFYDEDSTAYHSMGVMPPEIVEISSPGILKNQQVAVLRLKPAQFVPDKDQIKLLKKIMVRVNFTGGDKLSGALDKSFTALVDNPILINSSQAAGWRKEYLRTNQIKIKKENPVDWYKINIREEGIYKITGSILKSTGIDLREIEPTRLKIFNNGGFQLPLGVNASRADSLIENAIIVEDGGDSKFDDEDYILFYGKAVNGWKINAEDNEYSHYIHPYTRDNVYWMCWQSAGSGKRMTFVSSTNTTPAIKVESYRECIYSENEYTNLLNSGTTWFGDYFSAGYRRRNYQFDLSGVIPNEKASLKVNLAGVSSGEHRFRLLINNVPMSPEPVFYSSSWRSLSYVSRKFDTDITSGLHQGYNTISLEYQPAGDAGLAYLDWMEISYQRRLEARDDQLIFNGPDSNFVFQYSISSFDSDNILVFNITDFRDVKQLELSQIGNRAISFTDSAQSNKYYAISPKRFKIVSKIIKDSPSHLREERNGADFIVITYDDFYDAALALKSLRENCDHLTTYVAKISDVFDEFGWGLTDPAAIRDFIKFAFENWKIQPSFVLLLGDGDYDYKNIVSPGDPNLIPPFETSESNELLSRARDDWFVCVAGNDDLMDLAIGRIPARNPDQAFDAVYKIIEYENSLAIGEWCNTITMVADDELEQGGTPDLIHHIPDAEDIAEHLIPQNYNVRKIYLTEYPSLHDATISGIRKPAAHDALINQINSGSLIINFIGHGNEQLWTHERILVLSDDFPLIDNGPKQAFWIAATCNFGRFDNPDVQSFSEQLTTVAKKGAIAVFSPCRLADASQNVSLNKAFYRMLFSQTDRLVRLGDIISLAKNSQGNSENAQSYNLLGDPTLRLAMPSCAVTVDEHKPDSLKALCLMDVGGRVENLSSGAAQQDGQILFEAFDSRKERAYRVNDWRTYYYKLSGNILFRGIVSNTEGQFNARFIVPKDITYGGKEGRFRAFYWNNELFGSGYLNNLPVGGTETNMPDSDGPVIRIGFNGQYLTDHEFVPSNPMLHVTIADSVSGVNIAGDIGHEITMVLDDTQDKQTILNDFFQYEKDSYLVGTITYPLGNLAEGRHSIRVKAWDNNNNSSLADACFTIISSDNLALKDVFNFPNPFSSNTDFTFWVNQDCNVEIKVFTLSGRLICKLNNLSATSGFNHFFWNGEDSDGNVLANGVYLYKVKAQHDRSQAERIEKCVIMR